MNVHTLSDHTFTVALTSIYLCASRVQTLQRISVPLYDLGDGLMDSLPGGGACLLATYRHPISTNFSPYRAGIEKHRPFPAGSGSITWCFPTIQKNSPSQPSSEKACIMLYRSAVCGC